MWCRKTHSRLFGPEFYKPGVEDYAFTDCNKHTFYGYKDF